jgi:hypothetical protein
MSGVMDIILGSVSVDGDGVEITTASPIDGSDTLVHTAVSGTTDIDLVDLWAYNDHSAAVVVHIKWGDGGDSVKVQIPSQAGWYLLCSGLPICDGNTIEASAATVNVVWLFPVITRVDKV